MQNIFEQQTAQNYIDRLGSLKYDTNPEWGKMDAAQMLAHCNVVYEMIFEPEQLKKPNAFTKLMLKLMVKNGVVNEVPYKKNKMTAPYFKKENKEDFDKEKSRLISFIKQVAKLGDEHFDGKESFSFGKLNKKEWNNMMAKHLNHHFEQFGI